MRDIEEIKRVEIPYLSAKAQGTEKQLNRLNFWSPYLAGILAGMAVYIWFVPFAEYYIVIPLGLVAVAAFVAVCIAQVCLAKHHGKVCGKLLALIDEVTEHREDSNDRTSSDCHD